MSDTTGTEIIREALRTRKSKQNFAIVARDLGISSETLLAFCDGKRSLPNAVLQALVKELWHGHAEFDPVTDRLRPTVQDLPRPMGIRPENTLPLPKYQAGAAQVAPRPVKEPVPDAKVKPRPGWIGGWG